MAEVLIGIVRNDPESFPASGAGRRPAAGGERYGMPELPGEVEGDG